MSNNLDQLTDWLKDHKITEVECMIGDLTGITRGKISPTNKFIAEKGMRLPESVLLQTVTGDYVEDDIYYELLDPADIDMICRPDENAVFLVPWAIEPTAQVIHDAYDKQGNPIELSPRNVLKKVLKLYADKGWQPIVAPEMEFYLTKRSDDPDFPLQPPIGRSGRPETGRQSFSIEAANEFDPLFEDVYDWCELQELDLDTLIHEDGTAQMEINFRHGDALSLADQILVFKRTMREAALKHDVAATFMAKPMTGEPGSAMHLHQSIIDKETGKNVFSNEDGTMSDLFLHHIGGLQKFIPELLPLFAPQRQLVPPLPAGHVGAGERGVGRREPHRGPACAGCRAAEPAGGKPLAGRRRQPVPGDCRQPAVWLHRHGRRHQPERAGGGPRLRTPQPAFAADHRRRPGTHGKQHHHREIPGQEIHHRLRRGQAGRA
nr:glutamine synthetase family protein [Pseudomonas brassicacearum subsp. brassicacearum]